MDSTNPPNGWPHHRIPKVRDGPSAPPPTHTAQEERSLLTSPQRLTPLPVQRTHDDMQRGHRDSPEQAVLRHPTPFRQSTNSTPPASSAVPHQHHNHPQTSGLHLPPLRHRFAGDGFDFRRPAMSTSTAPANAPPADVIDLTSEDEPSHATTPIAPPMQLARASRPPRFAREIIDLSDDTPPHPPADLAAQNPTPSSPEVEFVSSRTIPGRRPPAPAVDLTDDDFDFDLLVAADFGVRHGINRAPPGDGGYGTRSRRNSPLRRRLVHILGERTSVQNQQRQRQRERRDQRDTQGRPASRAPYIQRLIGADLDGMFDLNGPPLANFFGPGLMNYNTVGFDMGFERESTPATYEAPPKAPPGFTRSPEEDDVLVCPNCDAELCVGPEGGEKRQVWIIKACGHVSVPFLSPSDGRWTQSAATMVH